MIINQKIMDKTTLLEFYWTYHCLHDLLLIDWKTTKFDKNGIPYSYKHRLDVSCPTLVEDGGYIESLEDFKLLFDTYKDEALYVAGYFLRHAEKLQEILPEDGLDLIRKSVLTCAKVSDEPIYKEVIIKFGWDIE